MRRILSFLVIILLCSQFGCAQMHTVDTQRMIHAAGFDMSKKQEFQGTILYPEYTHGVNTKPKTQTTTAISLETITSRLNAKSPHNIVVGQMRVVLFGKSFGTYGIGEIVNNLQRNPNIGRDVQLALVDGSSKKLLQHVKTHGSLYLADLLEQNVRNETIPRTALNLFLYDYYSKVRDPFLPYISIDKDQAVSVKGLAFLKKDKVVMYTDNQGSFLVKLLMNPTKNGRYEVPIQKGKHKGLVVIQNLSGKSIYQVNNMDHTAKARIRLKLNGLITSSPNWMNLTNKKNISFIRKQVENTLKKQAEQLIQEFQQKNIDPLGICDEMRSRTREWNIKEIRKMYPSTDIHVDVNVNIVQSGIGE
ncbi:Ger(x)C family spore germination protein [Bacillus cytotoxicus]|uniref:Ger(x)C family spore germination protein n=1 Tax=Bacillus cytotoxicus TaxID=580165 RepID=UPI00244B6FD8|nr:Ger(x)C family spore germination protein [Bacillus cytotoxicus]MDH2881024.1 Ger(x)C family spore germination protein [Bacillus cytotoxicus]